jgi:hypothetical protein
MQSESLRAPPRIAMLVLQYVRPADVGEEEVSEGDREECDSICALLQNTKWYAEQVKVLG